MTAHIESKKEDIAKKVIMPGDPMRAKYIADNFLTDCKLVNNVRGMLGFTGYYKNNLVTIFASGMGSPSIGIYAYELYHFYDVDTIIRIGTCGAGVPEVRLKNIVIASEAYTLSSFPKLFFDDDSKNFLSDKTINNKLELIAKQHNLKTFKGKIITSDIFDPYVDKKRYLKLYPDDKYLAYEMEAAILFCLAKNLNKKAACILTVVDNEFANESLSSEDREKSLDEMIKLSLDTLVELD